MKVSSKITPAINKQNPLAKTSTANNKTQESAQGNASRKTPSFFLRTLDISVLPPNNTLNSACCRYTPFQKKFVLMF